MSQAVASVAPKTGSQAKGRADLLVTALLWGQGAYYLATGVWPLVHLESFEAVTGPKTEDWLVKTVGVLVASIAIALLVAAYRRHNSPEIAVLALASAGSLTAIDVIYVSQRVIGPIYLADAVAEVILIGLWIVALARARFSA